MERHFSDFSTNSSFSNSGNKSYYDETRYLHYVDDHDSDSRSPEDWQSRYDNHERSERSQYERNYFRYRSRSRSRDRSRDRSVEERPRDRDRDYEHRTYSRDRYYASERNYDDVREESRDRDYYFVDSEREFKDRERRDRNRDRDRHERDRSYERERSYDRDKDRDYDRKRDYGRDHGDSERDRARSHDRDRDRSRRRDDRSRRSRRDDKDRNYDGDRINSHRDEESQNSSDARGDPDNFRNQPPNNTIMIRGLAQHITENDIRQDIIACNLVPKEIRLIRKRDTGTSRGFAFVEFSTLQEAQHWMEMKQGILMLQDQYRAVMLYSIPKDSSEQSVGSFGTSKDGASSSASDKQKRPSSDWYCIKCAAHNFRRRFCCYRCQTTRKESEEGGNGSNEVSQYATKTVMLRNLDALSTEDSVMAVIKNVANHLVKYIIGVLIGRDPLTSTSRGVCYLDMETTVEALSLHGILKGLSPPLTIDGKEVSVSFCKYRMGDINNMFPQVAFATANTAQTYTMNDLNALADYSASRYAKTPAQYQHYYEYYKQYFAQQIAQGAAITLSDDSQANSVNAAAAVAHAAIQKQRQGKLATDTMLSAPTGSDGKKYPIPDVSTYQYDDTTGYYYDSVTGLYYDATSQYYYNSVIQKYLYWDSSQMTYILAPTQMSAATTATSTPSTVSAPATTAAVIEQSAIETPKTEEKKKIKSEKADKNKVAKKIAKDMERWAKSMNKNKEALRSASSDFNLGGQSNSGSFAASADIGFAVLEKKAAVGSNSGNTLLSQRASAEYSRTNSSNSGTLVAAYGGGSDTSGDEDNSQPAVDLDLIEGLDWNRMICMLCKRQFSSKEALAKHQKVSELHRNNLEQYCQQHGITKEQPIKYRDRAKERRQKFGEADPPAPSKLKEKYLKSLEAAETAASVAASNSLPQVPIGSDNVGSKMLQKMGWSEGQGLGRDNQGRTSIIQAERLVSTAGLGAKSNAYAALPGESYKDCVKKMTYARYQELNN